jgi:SPP1 gp7 family putative phage head morphogenesis protein
MPKDKFKFSPEEMEDLLKGIFNGTITEYELPEELYYATADYLKSGLYHGFGIDLDGLTKLIEKEAKTEWTASDLDLLQELRENVYMFSAAKEYQAVRDMTDAITDEKGNVRSFKEFKEIAEGVAHTHYDSWLEAEHDTAIGQAQNAVRWQQIQRDKAVLPYLGYSGVEDANECEICFPLNGLVLPVDDPFWDEFMPENHFRCRCTVQQLDEDSKADVAGQEEIEKITGGVRERMAPEFLMNPGKDKVVFNDKHPYFENVPKEDRDYAANNFDLPIPDTDE